MKPIDSALPDPTESHAFRWPSVVFAASAAFWCYFCMYAFRKPFAAASYAGLTLGGTGIDLKTALVIGQIVGYTVSKYAGIRICSETALRKRPLWLLSTITLAELTLVLFAIVPDRWKVAAIFLNGLPLGLVWGLVISYLEGRRTSEILMAVLSCSFVVSSGFVKDVGRWFLEQGVSEAWMPAATGGIFLLPFAFSVWLMEQIPPPGPADHAERTRRMPMDARARRRFVRELLVGMVLLLSTYVLITAFRDFRDNYQVDILGELGYGAEQTGILTTTELPIALICLAAMALLNLVRSNRHALATTMLIMALGTTTIGLSTALLDAGLISGVAWMLLVGLGGYLTYIPFNSILFDRMIATTKFAGTAAFGIYLADALGYSGSVVLQLYKDLWAGDATRLHFFRTYSYFMSFSGTVLLLAACAYFGWRTAGAAEASARREEPIHESYTG